MTLFSCTILHPNHPEEQDAAGAAGRGGRLVLEPGERPECACEHSRVPGGEKRVQSGGSCMDFEDML